MKTSSLEKYFALFVGIVLGLCSGSHSYAGSNEVSGGQIIRWSSAAPLSYAVNPNCATTNPNCTGGLTSESQKLLVIGAIDDAFRAWTTIPGASIRIADAGVTQLTGSALDGVNVVSFQAGTVSLPPGTVAATLIISASTTGLVRVGERIINVEFPGQILDADILFNPRLVFSIYGADRTFDLVATLEHEAGHLLGLDHSGILSSIMNPYGDTGSTSDVGPGVTSRILQSDDMITAASIYPDPTAQTGTISGVITSSGAPVRGAHVVVVDAKGMPAASQISGLEGNGAYKISGLPPGNYQVFAEPLDGPITQCNFGALCPPGQATPAPPNFAANFFGGSGNPATVTLTAGLTSTANIAVPSVSSSLANISGTSSLLQDQTLTGLSFSPSNPLFLQRGKSYQLFVAGTNLGSDSAFRFSSSDIRLEGTASTPGNLQLPGQQIRQQNVSVSPTAALGPSNLLLTNSSSMSVMPGGIVITENPNVTQIIDAAGSRATLSPGAIVAIKGTDLSFGNGNVPGCTQADISGCEQAVATPLPGTMGGISVKVGDRYAPLFFVFPGQINAMIPYETSGTSAQLTVVAGPNALGNTKIIDISPSSPGIFTTNSAGTGQGIVFNGADDARTFPYAAPTGSIPGTASHPAKPGDVIVIWCAGMGPVTPALPSGIAADPTGTTIYRISTPQVLIGGQAVPPANVLFAGLTPSLVGLYQVNVQLPANVRTGDAVELQVITAQGQPSNTVTIAIGQQ